MKEMELGNCSQQRGEGHSAHFTSQLEEHQEDEQVGDTFSTTGKVQPQPRLFADHFPLELGFAITIHKVQGRTIVKIIVAISKHTEEKLRFIFEGVYTALSRVKEGKGIRLLLTNKDWSTINYISSLEKDQDITDFFKGYPDPPNAFIRWDPILARVRVSSDNDP